MDENWIIVATTLGGFGLGIGCASAAYVGMFMKSLKELHADNVELHADNVESAKLLIHSDKTRAVEVSTAAAELALADANTVRKVEEQNETALKKRMDEFEAGGGS